MTQEWDDILSEPMAQLQPDLPAAEGGWRAVRSIEEVSPRPQQPPQTLPDPDGMLSVRLPVQPEEATPASVPPPTSLTGQLSLTWAARRRARRTADEEPAESWPAWEPAPAPEPEPEEHAPLRLPLARPLRTLMRLFRRETVGGKGEDEPVRAALPHPETAHQIGRTVAPTLSVESLPRREAMTRPSSYAPSEVPLVHAQRTEPVPAPLMSEATPVQERVTEVPPTTPVVRPAIELEMPMRRENTLRRWLHRRRAPEAQPGEPEPFEDAHHTRAPGFQQVPLVDRHEHAPESHTETHDVAATPIAEARPPSHRDEGEPLPPVLRERMEKLLDVPLHQVRVFRNAVAHEATHAHRADGLAVGTEVHMAPGRGDPSTPSGQALLAHELSHVAARITGRNEPAHMEEQRAQAIEHSVRSQPDLVTTRWPAGATPAPLEHRAQPRSTPPPSVVAPISASYSGGGFVGGGGVAGATSGAPAAVHLAPVGRIPAVADSAMGGGGGGSMTRPDAGVDAIEAEEPEQDTIGGIDRIVEAVLRRLRREGSLERERRGAFRSEIGG